MKRPWILDDPLGVRCLDLAKPLLAAGETAQVGTVVIGTVEGDVHDIGKNLVAMMLEGRASRW